MRITFILPGYPWKPTGGAKVAYEYANQLIDRGHTVYIVHPRYMRNWRPIVNYGHWLLRKGARVFNYLFKPGMKWTKIDSRVHMLWVPEPIAGYVPDADAVFATAWRTADYVIDYPEIKGAKYYLVQDFYPYLGDKIILEKSWRYPLKKVAISKWIYELIIASGVPKEDVTVIPNGMDHARFRLLQEIAPRYKSIAMMYATASYKTPENGIKALEIVKSKIDDISVVCFGAGLRPRTLPEWIKYYSNIDEDKLVKLYNASSIFVSSSVAEGFALPPAEAMACGCAVAATDSGGIREYAEHKVTALLSKPGDVNELVNNIIKLIEDNKLRIEIAKKGYERIQGFTWEQSASLLEHFIKANNMNKMDSI